MSETIERLRAEVERAGGGHRGYLLAAEKAVVERDALQRRVDVVLARHKRQEMMTAGCVSCIECGDFWPCPTVRILDGKE